MGFTRFLVHCPFAAAIYSKLRGRRRDRSDRRKLLEADVVIVSFPKSGRTFVRTMLARLFMAEYGVDDRHVLKFAELRKAAAGVPRLLFTHDGDGMRRADEIRIDTSLYDGKRVGLLVRHPADTVISRYYHLRDRSDDPARQLLARQPLETFLWTPQGGIPAIVEFLNQWAKFADMKRDIYIVRYEDVLADPVPAIQSLARFVGLDARDDAVSEAVAFGRIDNLKAREREGYFRSQRFGVGRAGSESSYKVRSGKAGGYRDILDADQIARIDCYLKDHLDPVYGYSVYATKNGEA